MGSDLTGLVAAVRDSISACVIHILLVDCNRKQVKHLCMCVDDVLTLGGCYSLFIFHFLKLSLTERVLAGAEGLVRDTISWMAKRSLSLCRGLLMPISLWISVSDRLAMIAPLFTLARHAATYHAGIPTHSCGQRNWWIIDLRHWQCSDLTAKHTSSHVTTVGPSQDAKGRPWRHASSSKSCLARKKRLTEEILEFHFFFVHQKIQSH